MKGETKETNADITTMAKASTATAPPSSPNSASDASSLSTTTTVEDKTAGWVEKRLMKIYLDSCKELSELPNLKLLKKLYNLEVSEDEVVVSDCELQDVSITPLLNACKLAR
ncbi:hypothetical protein Vadar_008727 [Vaccinium darrowii]|uniref:Uncharacterized protein n=1 Tax=Vaccinium darrowii TaxID=229202 RepID=A0ACB7YK67_9ERIC|nr:hypothetical protein Vadar_008727 [Vaccinium darrowii]